MQTEKDKLLCAIARDLDTAVVALLREACAIRRLADAGHGRQLYESTLRTRTTLNHKLDALAYFEAQMRAGLAFDDALRACRTHPSVVAAMDAQLGVAP